MNFRMTGVVFEANKAGKTYYYIYDFDWMQFSDKELMIIKLKKPR